jgi:Glycosyl transferase family 2
VGLCESEALIMIDFSIVIPCLNESESLQHCLANAGDAVRMMRERLGLEGEIIVADNGSTDGSQEIAKLHGARLVEVSHRGYGAALIGGFEAALGRYLVMGDADASYDFRDAVAMVGRLADGADLCMGSRFKGGIANGAMPWKNRYIGNPILTGILNLFYKTRISDAHCGLRALTRRSFKQLRLDGNGMEFASEMVIKAALLGLRIDEVPATLSPDLRNRPPHLRPWRDGWRHLCLLLMLSPLWLFAAPATALVGAGVLLLIAPWVAPLVSLDPVVFGSCWTILGGALVTLGHQGLMMALAAELCGLRAGYRRPSWWIEAVAPSLSLDRMLLSGLAMSAVGLAVLVGVLLYWTLHDGHPLAHVLPAVAGTSLLCVGAQTILSGFLLAVLGGNSRRILLDGERKIATSNDRPSHAGKAA